MNKKIAIEGQEQCLIDTVRRILTTEGYQICYTRKSPSRMTVQEIIQQIIPSNSDLVVLCNAGSYISLLKQYCKGTSAPPLLALTGGGEDIVKKIKEYTPYVLSTPSKPEELCGKVKEILNFSD